MARAVIDRDGATRHGRTAAELDRLSDQPMRRPRAVRVSAQAVERTDLDGPPAARA